MASRSISATFNDSVVLAHEDSAVFDSSLSAGSAVSGMKCVGGEITFSKFRGYCSSFYFIIYIDGVEACETKEINDTNQSSTHTLTTYIDTDASIDSDALLKGSGEIEIVAINNNGSGNVCSIRDGCVITIKASYSADSGDDGGGDDGGDDGGDEDDFYNPYPPDTVTVSQTITADETVYLDWSDAEPGDSSDPVDSYRILYRDSDDNATWGSWKAIVSFTNQRPYPVPTPDFGMYRMYCVCANSENGGVSSRTKGWSESVYRIKLELEGFTDSPLVAGATPVKALHMTELHDRVNTLRTTYGLTAYVFSPIDERGIAGWADHVNEIKAAIDEFCTAKGKTHEAWIEFSVNCPRADVIEQLRSVVLSL